jgi:hypothetical protein
MRNIVGAPEYDALWRFSHLDQPSAPASEQSESTHGAISQHAAAGTRQSAATSSIAISGQRVEGGDRKGGSPEWVSPKQVQFVPASVTKTFPDPRLPGQTVVISGKESSHATQSSRFISQTTRAPQTESQPQSRSAAHALTTTSTTGAAAPHAHMHLATIHVDMCESDSEAHTKASPVQDRTQHSTQSHSQQSQAQQHTHSQSHETHQSVSKEHSSPYLDARGTHAEQR